jgi:hypothetical protein
MDLRPDLPRYQTAACPARQIAAKQGDAAKRAKIMDYSKSGSANLLKKGPKHSEHNQPGSKKNPFGKREDKAALLAKMKAAAEARKNG